MEITSVTLGMIFSGVAIATLLIIIYAEIKGIAINNYIYLIRIPSLTMTSIRSAEVPGGKKAKYFPWRFMI